VTGGVPRRTRKCPTTYRHERIFQQGANNSSARREVATHAGCRVAGRFAHYFNAGARDACTVRHLARVEAGEFVAIVGSSGWEEHAASLMFRGLIPGLARERDAGRQAGEIPSPRVGYMFQKDTLLDGGLCCRTP